jgi:cellulose synthase (UDP-forming)
MVSVGCQYEAISPEHHRLIADLVFANSAQWTQFQLSRRGNPGLLRGTLWFFGLALYQTYRGLVYLTRSLRAPRAASEQPKLAEAR